MKYCIRSAKQYSLQMMTEGHSGDLLVSESDWKTVPSGRSRSSKTIRGPKRTVLVAGPCASRLSESVTVRL